MGQPVSVVLTKNQRRHRRRAERKKRLKEECSEKKHQMLHLLEEDAKSQHPNLQEVSRHDADRNMGAGQWRASDTFYCEYHKKTHELEVVYVRNPRDVDMLAFYEDQVQRGWTMF